MVVTFTPVEKILLMFATAVIDTGSVIEQAFSPGALIDLTGTRPGPSASPPTTAELPSRSSRSSHRSARWIRS